MRHLPVAMLVPLALAPAVAARDASPATAPGGGVSLTVYSSADPAGFDPRQFLEQQQSGWGMVAGVPGFGLVRETRKLDVPKGSGQVAFTDVAAFIDPTTVGFSDLTDPATSVLEQRFEFDLVSAEKLLERFVDRPVHALVDMQGAPLKVGGTLLAARGGSLVIQKDGGIEMVPQATSAITLGELPGGLRTRPTLLWNLSSASGGAHDVRIGYQTGGLTWRADYNLTLDGAGAKADLSAWVTLLNVCGKGFEGANLKLVAGDVQRVQPRQARGAPVAAMAMMEKADSAGFQEKAFGDYHLYTLPRRVDLPQNASEQIALFPSIAEIPVEKLLVYQGATVGWFGGPQPIDAREFGQAGNTKVDVFVRLVNDAKSRLGMPLPAGKVRVFQRDEADGALEFVGEDVIGHTPRDEKVLIRLGSSFDVVGERTQTAFRIDQARRQITETFKIEIRNRKDAPATVLVREPLYRWTNWEIGASSQPFEKVNASTIQFTVDAAPNTVRTVTYTVQYAW
jgi:hypothetical protein